MIHDEVLFMRYKIDYTANFALIDLTKYPAVSC